MTMAIASSMANAQSAATATNAKRCQDFSASVQSTYQASLEKRIPKTDPGSAVQESQDIKGLMSTDAAGGFPKLGSINFSGILDKIVNKAMASAAVKGTETFNKKVNGILKDAGVNGINYQGVNSSAVTGYIPPANTGSFIGNITGKPAVATPSSAYARPGQ